jgi:hypothetical protein
MDLTPNLWCKFDTGALLTNDGTDVITLVNNGTATNAGLAVRGNNSLSLNGTTQYLSGTIEGFANNSISVSVWIYPKSGGHFFNVGNVGSIGTLFMIQYYTSKYLTSFWGTSSTSTDTFADDLNKWVHIVATYNLNTRERNLYRNGVKLNVSNPLSDPCICNNVLTIGKYGGASSDYFNGYMDDLRVFTGIVLSQAQITELYAGNPYYNFPTALTRYNTNPINTSYQFEVKDEEQKIISHY